MMVLWVFEDVRRALHRGKTQLRIMIKRGDIPVYATTPSGTRLFCPREINLYLSHQPPLDAVRNRFNDPVIVDKAGKCTDCGRVPTECLAERH